MFIIKQLLACCVNPKREGTCGESKVEMRLTVPGYRLFPARNIAEVVGVLVSVMVVVVVSVSTPVVVMKPLLMGFLSSKINSTFLSIFKLFAFFITVNFEAT